MQSGDLLEPDVRLYGKTDGGGGAGYSHAPSYGAAGAYGVQSGGAGYQSAWD